MQREINESENHHDEDDEEVEESEENRRTLNENNTMNHLNKSIDKALHSLSEAHLNEDKLKFQTSSTAWKKVWSETEKLNNEQWKAHCSTCTCSSSFIQQSLCL